MTSVTEQIRKSSAESSGDFSRELQQALKLENSLKYERLLKKLKDKMPFWSGLARTLHNPYLLYFLVCLFIDLVLSIVKS